MEDQASREDGAYANVFLNVGTRNDPSSYTKQKAVRFFSEIELEQLYEGDGFARKIIDLPAEEMVRAGFTVEGIDDSSRIISALENISAMELLCDALRWSDLHGGSIVVMLVRDGGRLDEPLNIKAVQNIYELRVYDRYQATRFEKYNDPNDLRFGKTKLYHISPVEGSPYYVHESRCLVFDGLPVPARVREKNDGWGASRLQSCYDQLERLNMSHYWVNKLLERAQQAIHGIPDLTNLLRSPGGEALVRKRVDLVDMTRSINNTIVIDGEEKYELKATTMTAIPDIMDRFGLALSSVSSIPESLLFGRQQGGLNSTGKSDLENWYAKVSQWQNTRLLPQLDKLVSMMMYSLGVYTDDYLIKFNPLTVPSQKDQTETDYKRSQTFEIYSNIGALDRTEIRKMLSNEGYEIDDVEMLPEATDDELGDTEQ